MSAGHPEGLPDLFWDRSLGRRQVPALLRDAGVRLHTLAEMYGVPADEAVADTEWLELVGQRGWPVLVKDERGVRPRAPPPGPVTHSPRRRGNRFAQGGRSSPVGRAPRDMSVALALAQP